MASRGIELMSGEQVVLKAKPHWWFFWKEALGCVGVLVLGWLWIVFDGWLETIFGWLALVALVGWLGRTGYQFVQWRSTQFLVTNRRVAYESGIVKRTGVSIPLTRVNNVNFRQSVIARLLDNGIVTIESAGDGDSVFENIPKPDSVRNVIFERMSEADSPTASPHSMAPPPPPPAAAPSASAAERLRQLDDLRAQGVVSDEEYDDKRTQIIGDL